MLECVMNIWCISDNHWSHANIIHLCNRPFQNIDEMDKYMIEKWNSVVNDNDIVIHCGDFALCTKGRFIEIMSQLKGRKILVQGNHDNRSWKFYLDNGFNLVCKYFSMKGILFTHRPFDYFDLTEEKLNVHGHIHNNELKHGYDTTDQKRINISVEVINYTPINVEELIEKNRWW